MKCESVIKSLSLFLYGELTFEEEEAVHQHVETCAACRAALDREQVLHGLLGQFQVSPPPALLTDCRQSLEARLACKAQPPSVLARLWDRISLPVSPYVLRPLAAVGLVALGFVSARLSPGGRPALDPAVAAPVVTEVRELKPGGSGGVSVVVSETRQRVLSGPLDDARIERLLLEAAQSPADPMLRLDSVDLLRRRSQSVEVRRALLQALRRDPNPVVRLRAIEGLEPHASEPDVRATLAQALLSDDNVGVRLRAIELLAQHQDAGIAGVLQEVAEREPDDYIRHRSREALLAMKASPETF